MADLAVMRRINESALLNLIKTAGQVSRVDLARSSGLSPSTVTGITRTLIQRGLVRETGPGESRGGRRSVLLELEPSAGYVVGLKFMEYSVALTITDLAATSVYSCISPAALREAGPMAAVAPIRAALKKAHVPPDRLFGIGIGLSGWIDADAGICRYSALLGWHDVAVREPFQAALDLPVWIDNDVNTLAIYEQWLGSGRGLANVLVVTIGRGVGLGIVTQGAFYRGSRGGAGEFGHTTLMVGGRPCTCGNLGCLEAYVCDAALLAGAAQRGLHVADTSALLDAAAAGDQRACGVYAEAGQLLGVGLANLVNLFDPELIVLAGEGARAGDLLFEPMRHELGKHTFDRLGATLRMVVEPSGDESWARGAASLVLRELFRGPLVREG